HIMRRPFLRVFHPFPCLTDSYACRTLTHIKPNHIFFVTCYFLVADCQKYYCPPGESGILIRNYGAFPLIIAKMAGK
ncbi:hypothetical protein ACSLNR_28370, partial [Escherichia coli]|uniref:hypothetical protein n=1 Tax=Escherichia coli TaxID=562 RepID=UPI003EE09BD9